MGNIYAYSPDASNFANIGLVGALMPISCVFSMQSGEFGEITIQHPYDEFGKWRVLQDGVIIKARVPVRLAPEIKNGAYITSVEKWRVSDIATIDQRHIWSEPTDGTAMRLLSPGETVIVIDKAAERYKIVAGNQTGWIDLDGIEYEITESIPGTSAGIESVSKTYAIRPQLFRIYSVKPIDNAKNKYVEVRARRYVYDLLGNLTSYKATGSISLKTALDGILNNCVSTHKFRAYTDIADTRAAVQFVDMNPIQAILDPSEGVVSRWSAQVVCDDYSIYALHKAGIDRGTTIEWRKNLIGVECNVDTSKVITAIRPRGEQENGEPLYLTGDEDLPDGYSFGTGNGKNTIYMDSAKSDYVQPKISVLDCDECKVSEDVDTNLARARMINQTIAQFESGCAMPKISLNVDYVALGDTEEFAQYKNLDVAFLYDTVHIRHPKIGVYAEIELNALEFDCCRERMLSAKFGSIDESFATISSWQVSSLSGNKIIPYSIGGKQMADDVINARHVQAGSINADALQANTVTAFIISAVQAKIGEIVAGKITSDELFAAILGAVKLSAEAGSFTFAEVKNLLANTMFVTQGVGDKIQIANLSVTEANIVSLSVGDLLIRNENGEMVRLYVDADGNVQTGDPIADGTLSGAKLIEGSITTAQLNAGEIFANNGTVMNLIAGSLTANEAFIDSIVTTAIGNLSGMLELYVRKDNLETYLRLLTDGVHVGQSGRSSEVVVTPETVDVRLNGMTYSQFASNYVQFGNYQLRRSADGGLVFKLKEV